MAAPTYSESPLASIDTTRLTTSRFVDGSTRKYPFRDVLGRVNIHLVNASLAEAEVDKAPEATCERLRAWQRHAVRALNARPKDERATLDELFADENAEAAPQVPNAAESPMMRRRLFPKPKNEDEPHFDSDSSQELAADRFYLCRMVDEGHTKAEREGVRKATRRSNPTVVDDSSSDSSDASDDDETYEVEAILEEDEMGAKGFLISWAGFGPEHNSWEPEWNIAPHLVEAYRAERSLARRHIGDDYMLSRQKMLWCASCGQHLASDSYSATQRRNSPAQRSCLLHHYKEGHCAKVAEPVSSVTGAKLSSHLPMAPSLHTTPPRNGAIAGLKRPRSSEPPSRSIPTPRSAPTRPPPPPPPRKAQRPLARALSQRAAALEMRNPLLFSPSSAKRGQP